MCATSSIHQKKHQITPKKPFQRNIRAFKNHLENEKKTPKDTTKARTRLESNIFFFSWILWILFALLLPTHCPEWRKRHHIVVYWLSYKHCHPQHVLKQTSLVLRVPWTIAENGFAVAGWKSWVKERKGISRTYRLNWMAKSLSLLRVLNLKSFPALPSAPACIII